MRTIDSIQSECHSIEDQINISNSIELRVREVIPSHYLSKYDSTPMSTVLKYFTIPDVNLCRFSKSGRSTLLCTHFPLSYINNREQSIFNKCSE